MRLRLRRAGARLVTGLDLPAGLLLLFLGDGISPHDGGTGQEKQRREGGEQEAHTEQLIGAVDCFRRRVETE